jgi:enediyne biosynthesis protein E4
MNAPPSLLRNDYRGANHWLTLRLTGAVDTSAIGAVVTVTAGTLKQSRAVLSQTSYYSHDDVRLHFGLGSSAIADRVEIRWPDGSRQLLERVSGDRVLPVTEPLPSKR